MKRTVLLLAIGFTTFTAYAQKMKEATLPASVKESFSKQYPGIKGAKWEKENENYEAEFINNKVETSVLYNAFGSLLETEIELKTSELPKEVSEYVAKNMAGKNVKEASKITNAKGDVTYKAQIEGSNYIFDRWGKFQNKGGEKNTNKSKD